MLIVRKVYLETGRTETNFFKTMVTTEFRRREGIALKREETKQATHIMYIPLGPNLWGDTDFEKSV